VTKDKATVSETRRAWGRYLLLFFLAAWMFVLGVLVGRGTAPVDFDTEALQKELLALRDAMLKKERETLERTIHGGDEAEKVPLEFYEALRTDGPDINDQIRPVAPATGDASAAAQAATVETPPHKTRAAIMAKRGDVKLKPAGAAPSLGTSPPAQTMPDAPNGPLSIQVAALKDGAAAERIVATLKKEGYPAYLLRQVVAGQGLWFKVRVGHYRDRRQAAADMARLTQADKHPILVEN
jgi:DedD protein